MGGGWWIGEGEETAEGERGKYVGCSRSVPSCKVISAVSERVSE